MIRKNDAIAGQVSVSWEAERANMQGMNMNLSLSNNIQYLKIIIHTYYTS